MDFQIDPTLPVTMESTMSPTNDKNKHPGHMNDKKIDDKAANAKKSPELSEEELKKVVGGTLGAPIFRKKP